MREVKRLDNLEFDRQAPVSAAVASPTQPPPPLTGAARTLDEAERLYAARGEDAANLEKAKTLYLDVLRQTDKQPVYAAAYYGLARIAALQKDPDTAEQLFRKTLELQPEPQIRAWALVYLGRLSLAAGDSQEAARSFQEALKVDGASETARKAAAEGLQDHSKQ
jgi:tetratricopeptide (TPR) repeat protein